MDEIKRKLAEIDGQLAGGAFRRRIAGVIGTSPLVLPALALMAGILLQEALGPAPILWLILLLLAGAATLVMYFKRTHRAPAARIPGLLLGCAVLCAFCLGAIRLTAFRRPPAHDIRRLVGNEPVLATIRGLIVTEPYVNRYPDWQFARFKFTDPATSFYLKVTEVQGSRGWEGVCGTVRAQVDQPVMDLKAGDCIQAYCWLDTFRPPTNPGQFNTARYLAIRNVFVGASIKSRDGIELLPSPPAALLTNARARIRRAAAEALLGRLPPDLQSRALLEALLLGYRRDIDSDTYLAFRTTGLLHFVSLSGMHMGILIGIFWWAAKLIGLLKRARSVVCIVAIALLLLVVPPRAPAVRAAVIGWVFCASFLFRRHSNPLNTLSLAAVILLLIRPTQLFEAGWQLSFSTVLGILLFTDKIGGFLHRITGRFFTPPGLLLDVAPALGLLKRFGAGSLTLLAVGLAAWIGGAGVMLYHFYTITPLAAVWTALLLPLVGAILALGFLKMILFFLLPTLGAAVGVVVTLFAQILIWAVRLLAHVGFSQILVGHVRPEIIIGYYLFVFFAAFAYFRRPLAKRVILSAMFLVLSALLIGLKWQRTTGANLVLTALDVGHGQAVFVRFPGGRNALFDAGSLHKSDVGARTVEPFLRYNGIDSIDAVLISHNDIDHVNGIPELLRACRVGQVFANPAFFAEKDQWSTAKFLDDRLSEKGFIIERFPAHFDFQGAARTRVLWPDGRVAIDNLSDNDKSLVLLIEFAGTRILLCSDIEQPAQKQLRRLQPDLRADVVVVPHHGSLLTADPGFTDSLEGQFLIYSCARTQYETLRKADQPAAACLYTPRDGAITVCIDPGGTIEVTPFVRQKK